jgi:hypothetical protein
LWSTHNWGVHLLSFYSGLAQYDWNCHRHFTNEICEISQKLDFCLHIKVRATKPLLGQWDSIAIKHQADWLAEWHKGLNLKMCMQTEM